ncbi:hypothetical protein ACKWTF_007891 [Chironomus riparius]
MSNVILVHNETADPDFKDQEPTYKLDELPKEELVQLCNKYLGVAKKAKKSKDEAHRENELMKRELKELRGTNYDLELENQILKRDKIYPPYEDESLIKLPSVRHIHDDDRRMSCFWRFGSLFKK